jgi:hypothetical protein
MGGKQSMITIRIDEEIESQLVSAAASERLNTGFDSITKTAMARKLIVAGLRRQRNQSIALPVPELRRKA